MSFRSFSARRRTPNLRNLEPGYKQPPVEPKGIRPPRGIKGPKHAWHIWFRSLDSDPNIPIEVPSAALQRFQIPYTQSEKQLLPLTPYPKVQKLKKPQNVKRAALVALRRVSRGTGKGKKRRTSALVVAGNCDGVAGYGFGKHPLPAEAVRKATQQAIKNMVLIPRYNLTVNHNIETRFHSTILNLFPRPPGFGCRVNHNIQEICRCAGIADLSGKVRQSVNPINVVRATFKALLSQQNVEMVARTRGLRVHDVKKLAYG